MVNEQTNKTTKCIRLLKISNGIVLYRVVYMSYVAFSLSSEDDDILYIGLNQ